MNNYKNGIWIREELGLKRAMAFLLVFCLFAQLAGCVRRGAPESSPSPLATASPTPVKATPSPTPEATATPSPTPEPTEDNRVTIAEGFYYVELTDEIKARITGLSYPQDDTNAAIYYDDLRYVGLLYYDFEGNAHEGELIVNALLAREVTEIFYELYQAQYPFTSIRLVDEYGEAADDNVSMAANNTSCFNYRLVAGTSSLSMHSYGAAIDINPRLNPYVKKDGSISPENGAQYADRSLDFPGKIDHDDLAYKLFTERGWNWGGDWKNSKDYQHFSKAVK